MSHAEALATTAMSLYVVLPAAEAHFNKTTSCTWQAKNFIDMLDNSKLTRTLPTSSALVPLRLYPAVFTYNIYSPPPPLLVFINFVGAYYLDNFVHI